MNKVELVGRIGKDPDIRETKNGGKVARFSLAINEGYLSSMGDYVKNTSWHNVVLWNEVISQCENILKKGSCLYISGRLNNRSYVDKEGQKKFVTEIVGQVVESRAPGQDQGVV